MGSFKMKVGDSMEAEVKVTHLARKGNELVQVE